MNIETIEKSFERMGARAVVSTAASRPSWRDRRPFSLDIGEDREGEYFFLCFPGFDKGQAIDVLAVDKSDRHLLLLVREGTEKSRFLCGHDERHWFVAAIPESERPKTVKEAKDALKPKDLPLFRNWIRQGEWFFVPRPEFRPPRHASLAFREPLVRRTSDGRGGKPHIAAEAYRHGGTSVWVHTERAPQGWNDAEYKNWRDANPKLAKAHGAEFRRMVRDAKVYVRGNVRHPDHATVKLGAIWHEVLMNREPEARAMRNMVFLD